MTFVFKIHVDSNIAVANILCRWEKWRTALCTILLYHWYCTH